VPTDLWSTPSRIKGVRNWRVWAGERQQRD